MTEKSGLFYQRHQRKLFFADDAGFWLAEGWWQINAYQATSRLSFGERMVVVTRVCLGVENSLGRRLFLYETDTDSNCAICGQDSNLVVELVYHTGEPRTAAFVCQDHIPKNLRDSGD